MTGQQRFWVLVVLLILSIGLLLLARDTVGQDFIDQL